MKKVATVSVISGLLLFCLTVMISAAGVGVELYPAGVATVGIFTNSVGEAITGLHIEFDREVTIVNKVEIGGFLPATGELTGTVFDFAGGSLVAGGAVDLDWEPAEGTPTLVQWLSDSAPIGTPYFTTLDTLGELLTQGIVSLREKDPELLASTLGQFFADNEELFAALGESIGVSIADELMPVIMTAPAEGIANFFNTFLGLLGVESLEAVQQQVNLNALLSLIGG
jgi:hypothetical protein